MEFYLDHAGRVLLRPRRAGVDEFLAAIPPRMPEAEYATDDDAVAAAVEASDRRSRSLREGR